MVEGRTDSAELLGALSLEMEGIVLHQMKWLSKDVKVLNENFSSRFQQHFTIHKPLLPTIQSYPSTSIKHKT